MGYIQAEDNISLQSDKKKVTATDLDVSGETKRCMDINVANQISGDFSPSGLKIAMRTTTMEVSTIPIPIPAIPLADRNSIEIQNLDDTEILYVGNSDVTADRVLGTTSGKEIDPGSFWSLDVTETIILHGVVASGTIQIKVTEVA